MHRIFRIRNLIEFIGALIVGYGVSLMVFNNAAEIVIPVLRRMVLKCAITLLENPVLNKILIWILVLVLISLFWLYAAPVMYNSLKKFFFIEFIQSRKSLGRIAFQLYFRHGCMLGSFVASIWWTIKTNYVSPHLEKNMLPIFMNIDFWLWFVLIGVLFVVGWQWPVTYLASKSNQQSAEQKSNEEKAIASLDEDLLGMAYWVDRVILNLNDNSIEVIGVYGINGLGKTSLINLVEEELKNKTDEKSRYLFSRFIPCRKTDEKALAEDFFQSVLAPLTDNGYFRGLSPISQALVDIVFESSKSFIPIPESMRKIVDGLTTRREPEQVLKPLIRILEELELKIVVVIDDLDRCSHKNRYLMFRFLNTLKLGSEVTKGRLKFIICASAQELFDKSPSLMEVVA